MISLLMTILSVLRVIGIILLILLALVILVICLILFAPVCFRVQVTSEDHLTADGCVSWLGHVLRLLIRYDEEMDLSVRILGIQIYPKKEKTGKEAPSSAAKAEETGVQSARSDAPEDPSAKTAADDAGSEEAASDEPADLIGQNTAQGAPRVTGQPQEAAQSKDAAAAEPAAEKKRHKHKKQHTRKKEKPRDGRTSRGGSGTLGRIREVVGDEDFGEALGSLCSILGGFFGSIRFRELSGDVDFSLGSPDLTGMVTGVISTIPVFYGRDLSIAPDFASDEAYLRGTLCGGGSLRLVHLLTAVIRFVTDKKIKKIMHLIQK